ncbi:MAG: dTMP kinase [Planctomycetes bacterium]|nr:dTMP kinase [Planctomycetota bacterium]
MVFDGPDGSGKSTQFRRFADAARAAGLCVVEVREPGGTAIGEKVRAILLDPANADMTTRTEMLLYMASRAQLYEQRIAPAIAAGSLVLADRFVSSTLAYQGTAGGLDEEEILAVGQVATGNHWPDLTVVFDVPTDIAMQRLSPLLDRIESKGAEFHARVRAGYAAQARRWPDRYAVVDSGVGPDEVTAALLAAVRGWSLRGAPVHRLSTS